LIVSSTVGAVEYYKKRGFKPVKAYRLAKSRGKTNEHLYRHRIPDKALTEADFPSIMLYLEVASLRS
jgi:predicted N-acetyltransferase YhbS